MIVMKIRNGLILTSIIVITACGGGGGSNPALPTTTAPPPPEPVMIDFEVRVSNLTAGQPLSPIALIAHEDGYSLFELGTPASTALELLSEAGDNSDIIAEADADNTVSTTLSAGGPLPPGATEVMVLSVAEDDLDGLRLSLVSMMVNTNDAITAAKNVDFSSLAEGERMALYTYSYDAGTEANSEAAGSIPGPADGGEGFNAARDDISDEVRGHPGVVTADDGLSTSVLTQVNRWDNPLTAVTITRMP
jgi:hypothetical protein